MITNKALGHEFPQVAFLDWHWRMTWHVKKLCININVHSIMEELTCKTTMK